MSRAVSSNRILPAGLAVVILVSRRETAVWKGFRGTPVGYGRHRLVGLDQTRLNPCFVTDAEGQLKVEEAAKDEEMVSTRGSASSW